MRAVEHLLQRVARVGRDDRLVTVEALRRLDELGCRGDARDGRGDASAHVLAHHHTHDERAAVLDERVLQTYVCVATHVHALPVVAERVVLGLAHLQTDRGHQLQLGHVVVDEEAEQLLHLLGLATAHQQVLLLVCNKPPVTSRHTVTPHVRSPS